MDLKILAEAALQQQKKITRIDPKTYEAQLDILHDLYQSNETEQIEKRIQEIDKEIADCQMKITRYQNSFLELLQNTTPESIAEENKEIASDTLKFAFNEVNNQINSLCQMSVDSEVLDVPITAVYDIENQIIQIIEQFKEEGSFRESEGQLEKWRNRLEEHNQKVLGFLSSSFHQNDSSDSSDDNF
ncbi:hypothetical protein TVAG_170130 [Trichomonas vaginalis G3]|uniref:Uncharacterized protein n=1 Tax=Trichomonas vaginalis (strain ATCC PRA-98 / G3) TaxID=412133 RepID=A2DPF6_TRIV3|nr:hypothetical protein TVAGG3_0680790 [Trichomonas vaginalis G3]EAY17700.1 hypothetical protein TVAG_170130 [Trichomonas vaginalis G3]KAI5507896.1 hypothetical protein TVAGG3_0680790 [Trichomonas vaginalis G3]|eukprot:XP_001329835.1 hypothetical protein [Trichomonas vaginalis G3]